jgi:hypothetical protein
MCTLLQGVHGNGQIVVSIESPLSLDYKIEFERYSPEHAAT